MLAGMQIGPFTVEKELGSGAMGSVYRARYDKTGKRVAIKLIAPGLGASKKAMERFEREAAILKQLNHPHIVRLYAVGKYQGTPYYAMEYIEGESLDHVMARRGRITWEEVVAMGRQLCAALQHAHERGIVHRDLKPSNLMVLKDGTLKLADFGIAKDMDVAQLTSANCTVGTAAYMSPEQCKGDRDLTHKSDLYSLGVVFYELVTGRKPFIADIPMDMFLQHVQGVFERPSRLVLDVPVWLDNLICQLLEKKPEQRPLDAGRVGEALDQILEKVEAQQSAGVDAVNTRLKDRARTDMVLDDHDREAARTLLGRKKKSKRKKGGIAFYRKIWFKAVALSAVLVAVIYLLVLQLQPKSPKTLFDEATTLMDKGEWQEAREGPIKDYLASYGDNKDDIGKQMHAYADEVEVKDLERKLSIWINLKRPTTGTLEPEARRALELEKSGDLDAAWKKWQSLLEQKNKTDRKERVWGLLAEKHLVAINNARLDMIRGKLKQAEALAARKPEEAKAQYQDIIERYEKEAAGDPEIARVVKAAQDHLKK